MALAEAFRGHYAGSCCRTSARHPTQQRGFIVPQWPVRRQRACKRSSTGPGRVSISLLLLKRCAVELVGVIVSSGWRRKSWGLQSRRLRFWRRAVAHHVPSSRGNDEKACGREGRATRRLETGGKAAGRCGRFWMSFVHGPSSDSVAETIRAPEDRSTFDVSGIS